MVRITVPASPTGVALLAAFAAAIASSRAQAQTLAHYHEGSAWSHFGSSVAGVHDLDGDGADEYVVGSPLDSQSSAWSGRVMIYSGKSGTLLRTLIGATGTLYGWSVADAGDANGDGIHDVAIGAPGDASYGTDAGRLSIVSGVDGSTLVSITGAAGERLGSSVAGFDDVDGDGLADVIAGAPGWNGFTGRVRVFNRFGTALWTVNGTQSDAWFGSSVADAGNIKSYDGTRDVIVGEPFWDSGRTTTDVGRAHVLSGIDGATIWTLQGDSPSDSFGSAVSGGADLNGDSYQDLLVGAPGNDLIAQDAGFARGFSGFTGNSIFTVRGDDSRDILGAAVLAIPGDLNADGSHDFIVGAPGNVFDGEPGLARLYTGGFSPTFVRDFKATTDNCNPRFFGAALASGNFNGSGPLDLAVGMPGDWWTCDERGSVWVYTTWRAVHFLYGTGWAGKLGIPVLDALSEPVLGARMQLFLGNSLGAPTTAFLFIGLKSADIPTSADGHLLVQPLLILPLPVDKAGLTLDGVVPDDDALAGISVYLQALELDPGASKGLSFTAGLELVLGYAYP